ncbi:hypothetical protein [Candidatus Thiodictyon syntrophicum]|jgi:hypothetical protein|uniref:hypothetical protein n=1 Tax=Candidatus Thiodictyon syntrophicum TaxID=1166950 RepID=UPI000C2D3617|nr:hypothetical protein [Candidatus Thiodictyon syntrophicum]
MAPDFVVCVQKEDLGDVCGDDIQVGRLYEVVERNAGHGMIRIIDDSGDHYLYPATCFKPVFIQDSVALRLSQALPHN